jgi:hypothetical protein
MNATTQKILDSFNILSDEDKKELASEIIKRTLDLEIPPLSDHELTRIADDLFSDLDRREA